MVSIAELQILLSGKDQASGVLKGVSNEAGGLGDKLGTLGKVAGIAFAAVGAGAAAGALKGLTAFAGFQTQMNEVFTLMPGISGEAMKEMEGQVKNFSKEFGVLPDEVVPSLYSAISAGVPANNVFEFLETAQKAAKGGVTDLATAVDGISSVVNSYGADILGATEASDLMFTAVKLGKTDFEQLSKSLFNVVPTAASLGVEFGDVTAALARLTSQGTPTSVATTQIRAALVEASKGGSKLDTALRDLHGKGFTDLIADGKNIGEIFESMRQSMPEQEFKDLFGSVEAMNAALGITGPQFDAFQDAVTQMGDSTGATDAAFEQMSKGLADSMAKIKANIAVLWIEIGSRLAPVVEKLLKLFIEKGIPALSAFAERAQELGRAVIEALEGPLETARELFDDKLLPAMERFRDFAEEKLLPPLQRFADWFKNNESAMQAAGVAIGAVLVTAFAALAISAGAAAVAMVAAALPIIAIVAVVAAVAAGVFLLVKHWDDLSERFPILQEGLDALIEYFERLKAFAVEELVPALVRIGEAAMAAARFVKDNWGTIAAILKPIIDQVKAYIELIVEVFSSVVAAVVAIINGDWTQAWEEVKDILRAFKDFFAETLDNLVELMKEIGPLLLAVGKLAMEKLWEGVQWIWNSVVKPGFAAMPGLIVAGLGALGSLLLEKGKDILRGLWDGITNIWGQQVVPFFQNLPGRIVGAIGSLAGVLFAKGVEIIQGLIDGIKSMAGKVADAVADAIPGVPSLTGGGGGTFQGGQFGPEARAIGGPVTAGYPYIVGEKGEELFVPETNGRIVPNGEFGGEGEAGGIHFHAPVTIMARDRADAERSMRDIQFALRARGA